MRKSRLGAGALAVIAAVSFVMLAEGPSAETAAEALQIPDTFSNLQVLPKDVGRRALIGEMRNMAIGLGVRCWYCHVGEGDDFSTFDFPNDSKAEKRAARKMLRMVREINGTHLKGLESSLSQGQSVTCATCHQGRKYPPKS